MTEVGSRRVVVEVCSARNLMPKDGQGTATAYAIVDFDGQRRRTKTKPRDLNPQWDESLEFLVHDPDAMAAETLEVNVYNDKKGAKRGVFLGKVKISGATFAKAGSETLVYYPLEKRSVFSQVKGEIGLKVFYADDVPAPPTAPPPAQKPEDLAENKAVSGDQPAAEEKKPEETKAEEAKQKGEDKPAETANKEEKPPETPKPEEAPPTPAKPEENKKLVPMPEPASPAKDPHRSNFSELEARPFSGDRPGSSNYDLVDCIPYLFVRILKAKHAEADCQVFAKVVIGSHIVRTRTVKCTDWDQVFAFHKSSLNSTDLEVSVFAEKDGEISLGTLSFDLQEIPKRSPPDSPLAPQWHTLEGSAGNEVMLAVWIGTQADEAFQEAWQSDSGGLIVHTRSKAYLSPKLWYLRLTVIQTQDLRLALPRPGNGPELCVKAQLGSQIFKTGRVPLCSSSSSANPSWNEDLVFVAAEPFDPFLAITLEDATTAGGIIGNAKVPISSIHRRVDDRAEPPSRWLNLARDEARPYAGRVHVRACLEGGYHVLDEAAHVASDVRAASNQLSKPPVGILEVGVRGAENLVPMKVAKDGSTDAYVVLKYGPKWARTRTIVNQFNPRWNEQYSWEVFDPCTVLTVAVFDNARCEPGDTPPPTTKDVQIGKVRIRLAKLDTNRVYANTYPLTAVYPAGAKKMGEIELAVRFSCSSWLGLMQAYGSPVLPRMHYVRPLAPAQQDALRHAAVRMVSARLARSEPPLGPEVVQHMLDADAHAWSVRRSKANWFRAAGLLARVAGVAGWAHALRTWVSPGATLTAHVMVVAAVAVPNVVVPTAFLYLFLALAWRYRGRPVGPVGMDPRLSQVDTVGPDELDEEFDGFPSGRTADQVRVRYDRLRVVAGRVQALLGDVAAQGERVEALLSWQDSRATGIFGVLCLLAAVMFYLVPFRVLLLVAGFYYLRHPRFRSDMPSPAFNFFRRLPSLADRIL